ncbi:MULTISPECIES: hypothetical protein [Bradyrhizobium]|uniref:hypothetical protein n=1 Tax=Bradyrhizobium TaxID=374 RepID=UPI001008DB65|nr:MULTISPECIES: hypothetical protein [Bradyrhizobium]MDA9527285.1 hypothetical protein [Bradyrhizobium sp. CCBAU 25338]RXH33331.1 hypothetical protein XH84_10185 [Bradyrhizobium nanningense]
MTNKIDAYYPVSDLQKATCSDESRPNGAFLRRAIEAFGVAIHCYQRLHDEHRQFQDDYDMQ